MKPILFKPEFIHTIIKGTKTQTRRLVKRQPQNLGGGYYSWQYVKGSHITFKNKPFETQVNDAEKPYKEGDFLWVRESWAIYEGSILYKADEPNVSIEELKAETGQGWRSPIHLRKEDSRLHLQVTGVSLQRLTDISETDAKKEGVTPSPVRMEDETVQPSYKKKFFEVWREIHGEESVENNPFVWVIDFKVKEIKGVENGEIDN